MCSFIFGFLRLNVMFLRSIHICRYQSQQLHSMDTVALYELQFDTFSSWWTLRLFPVFHYYEKKLPWPHRISLFVDVFFISLGKIPRRIGGSYLTLSEAVSKVGVPFHMLTSNSWVPVAPRHLSTCGPAGLFTFSSNSGSEVVSHCGFICTSLMTDDVAYLSFVAGHWVSFFCENFVYIFIYLFQHICWEDFSFCHGHVLVPLSKINWLHMCGSILFHWSICLSLILIHTISQ